MLGGSASASVGANSLAVSPPKHAVETTRVSSSRSFTIRLLGFARDKDHLYLFEEGGGGCSELPGELEYARDAQEHYYRVQVQGQFQRRTVWSSFQDAGKHWACAYLVDTGGAEILQRFAPFTVAAPSIGRLKVFPPSQPPSARQRYPISVKGFATKTDSLWIYVQRQAAGSCLGWYRFYDSTHGRTHPRYHKFVVHGHFSRRTRWTSVHAGGYRACVYLAETAAYPTRILSKVASYRIS